MPKREDIRKIMVLGSGPIVIGQACEFDYSGTQACKALREEGYHVVLLNSNPASIMTDVNIADAVYIEPLTLAFAEKIIEKEKPDALLPTVGGQTALNLAKELHDEKILAKHSVELIGAKVEAINKAEDREMFKKAMDNIGIPMARGGFARNLEESVEIVGRTGYPAIIRPSFTLGGKGGGIAYNIEEFKLLAQKGLEASPVKEILIEESLIGWKEFELEVIRDLADNVIIICSIENLDPMGVHTGDSITVAPAQTLTDVEYQKLRDWSKAVIREIGVETGGSNVQFAVNPVDGRIVIIEMNPRVSRSSALASKATGYPIAKVAAKLAIGYRLDEIENDITKSTPASFEPSLDYVVTKVPRWEFEKFPGADDTLNTQMKSIGEVMSIGRTFKESLQKAFRSLENGLDGLDSSLLKNLKPQNIRSKLINPNEERLLYIHAALKMGWNIIDVQKLTNIDPWFLFQIQELVILEEELEYTNIKDIDDYRLKKAKRWGFSDAHIARLLKCKEDDVIAKRKAAGIKPVFKRIDTCSAEFASETNYFYSTYEQQDESRPTDRKKVVILGSGPNRIGQAIEFDYCCCQASFALREAGVESIMVNCNPETVSTDYDTSDRLYFEPLGHENVLEIINNEKPYGVILQFGGQTPLKLAQHLENAGIKILGTQPEGIDLAEDRERFGELINSLNLNVPEWGMAGSPKEALEIADKIGYPVLVRPSYVLGGRKMAIVYSENQLQEYIRSSWDFQNENRILVDRFLEDAIEIDVDAICDGERTVITGILQHIEEAGIHSGDSCMALPNYIAIDEELKEIRRITSRLADALSVKGMLNIQYAIKDGVIYIIEVNPRASRTVPLISKATGEPIAKIATRVMLGESLEEIGFTREPALDSFTVKAPVFPFKSFAGVDPILGPSMKSTGEVMGRGDDFGSAFAKAMTASGIDLPVSGAIFVSVNDYDKENIVPIVRNYIAQGFEIVTTEGTGKALRDNGLETRNIFKIHEGRPNVLDFIKNNDISMIINTPLGNRSFQDDSFIRTESLSRNIPCLTTLSAAAAALEGIKAIRKDNYTVSTIKGSEGSGRRGE